MFDVVKNSFLFNDNHWFSLQKQQIKMKNLSLFILLADFKALQK